MTKNANVNKNDTLLLHHRDRDIARSWLMSVVYSKFLPKKLEKLEKT